MAERNPSDDQAAFGVFPQLKRNRAKQDREAAKNVPIDLARGALAGVLGAPGDIESLVRMLPYLDEKTVLPTSEDIEKRIPLRSDTPVSKAATGLGILGGGFYTGPGSPLRVAGALPGALKHGAEEFAKASVAGVPHVIKPKGGNWLGNSVEKALDPLLTKGMINNREIPYGPDFDVAIRKRIEDLQQQASQPNYKGGAGKVAEHLTRELDNPRANEAALNKWIQSNLTNYVKKEMATPEDPIRKLAEQGITHFPIAEDATYWARKGESARQDLGGTQMAQSDLAKQWENRTDPMFSRDTAEQHQDMMHLAPGMYSDKDEWIKKLTPETNLFSAKQNVFNRHDLGFDHIRDVLRYDLAQGRIRPDQLNKVSMEQAVRRTYEYDQEMARKMREAAIKQQEGFPVYKEYPEGYRWIELAEPKSKMPEDWKLPEGYTVKMDDRAETKSNPWFVQGPNGEVVSGDKGLFHATPEKAIENVYGKEAYNKLQDALKYEGNTMGHCVGGYCPDVASGKTRIFSLRDAKGEPHVTVEVQPSKYAIRWDVVKEYMPAAEQEAKNLPNGYTDNDVSDIAMRMAKENEPQHIIQIKGKQNAAPKADYLPYVQDFVKSGNWGQVGDLKNTGLRHSDDAIGAEAMQALKEQGVEIPKYITQAEAIKLSSDAMSKAGKYLPPAEGMKRGGVAISHNPDTMMLEVNNRKMAGGGLTKLLKGAKEAVKAEPEIMKASEALGKIEGRPLVITQADRTKVGEGYLGGPGFSSLQLTEPEYRAAEAAWGVKTPGVAKMILGGAKKAGDKPVFTTMIGSPTQHQSNQMVFDKLYGDFKKAAKKGGLPTELRNKINDRLVRAVDKEGNPVFPPDIDILDKKFKDIANTFDRRSIAGHLMGGVQVGGKKGQIIDYDKIIRDTTDPALIDVPSGSLGNRLFTLSGGIIDRPDLHPAFPTILQGEDLGFQFSPVAKDILMRDFIEKTMREKGRKPGYMDFTRGHPPSQLITEDILTEMQKLGLKEGGDVKKPAAKIDGNEFVLAAQKYGIKDSMNNLNKIVDLVNKGLTVDDAARQVADTGMHKAAGGAITGDDLIIEERPL